MKKRNKEIKALDVNLFGKLGSENTGQTGTVTSKE